jgi:hypothetical protein
MSRSSNPRILDFESNQLTIRVVDEAGKELARPESLSYSGGRYQNSSLVLPYDSNLTFNVSQSGMGIPKDKAALLDMGPENCWVIDSSKGQRYFLEIKWTVPQTTKKEDFYNQYWHGTIEIPKAEIPLK